MRLKTFNKASAAVVSGAIVTLIGALIAPGDEALGTDPLGADLLGAVQTLLTALLVYLVPNQEA